jgi:hypothetical protein
MVDFIRVDEMKCAGVLATGNLLVAAVAHHDKLLLFKLPQLRAAPPPCIDILIYNRPPRPVHLKGIMSRKTRIT